MNISALIKVLSSLDPELEVMVLAPDLCDSSASNLALDGVYLDPDGEAVSLGVGYHDEATTKNLSKPVLDK